MSKHNYSQYSKKDNRDKPNSQNQKPVVEKKTEVAANPVMASPEVKMEVVPEVAQPKAQPVMVQETVETVALPNIVDGVVARCSKLNVREKPIVTSEIVCVLNVTSEIKIDVAKSTNDWFYVCCATGAEGYCMREYIDAHL